MFRELKSDELMKLVENCYFEWFPDTATKIAKDCQKQLQNGFFTVDENGDNLQQYFDSHTEIVHLLYNDIFLIFSGAKQEDIDLLEELYEDSDSVIENDFNSLYEILEKSFYLLLKYYYYDILKDMGIINTATTDEV